MADLTPENTMNTLYGVPLDKPNYGASGSREFVLEGVRESIEPLLRQQQGQLSRRGFTGRFYSPTIQAQAIKPVIGQAAESVRRGLTDLFYRDEELDLAKRRMSLEEKLGGKKMRAMDEQYEGGKVLCTVLYRLGMLPFAHIISDYKYLKRYVDKETHENYLRWASPLAKTVYTSLWLKYAVWPFIRLWSGYMRAVVNHKPIPISGLIVHKLGIAFGKFYKWYSQKKIMSCKRAVI